MLTLRLFFHSGRLECVTCHVPVRKSLVGGMRLWSSLMCFLGRSSVIFVAMVLECPNWCRVGVNMRLGWDVLTIRPVIADRIVQGRF